MCKWTNFTTTSPPRLGCYGYRNSDATRIHHTDKSLKGTCDLLAVRSRENEVNSSIWVKITPCLRRLHATSPPRLECYRYRNSDATRKYHTDQFLKSAYDLTAVRGRENELKSSYIWGGNYTVSPPTSLQPRHRVWDATQLRSRRHEEYVSVTNPRRGHVCTPSFAVVRLA
jgi:hypothetical protein